MMQRQSIALFGGTFDPFHRGHLEPVLSIASAFEWSRIIFIPAYRQPFKLDHESASSYHRFAMAVLGTNHDDRLEVSSIELERGEVSWTVDTLEYFRAQHSDSILDWVIGADNIELLGAWRAIDRILEIANFVVLERPGEDARLPSPFVPRLLDEPTRRDVGSIILATNSHAAVSATEIRTRLREGRRIADLVSPDVARYIRKNRLYTSANRNDDGENPSE